MERERVLRPVRLWQSLLMFGVPALFAVVGQYVLWPAFARAGLSDENAYNTALLLGFVGLLVAAGVALRLERIPLRWAPVRERLRLRKMTGKQWAWTVLVLLAYLIVGYGLGILAQMAYDSLGFWPPDADVPLTNIPYAIVLLVLNILGEELWWRGYILPRQELQHGRWAWLVNGVLWSLFHLFKWWAVPFLALKQWMIPLLAQRFKNTTPALVIHFVSNGLGILMTLLPLLTG